ncbi:MAG: ribonuclease Y [Candidatus Kapabacteria bacterium]|jgi:ribonuclease Y|nr:ribonuclease Y [Candidatus Kapabacteria bacterium]
MDNLLIVIVGSVAAAIGGFFIAYFIGNKLAQSKVAEAELKASALRKESKQDAERIKKEKLLEVKEEWHRKKQNFENDTQSRRVKLNVDEKQVKAREDEVRKKTDFVSRQEKTFQSIEGELLRREKEVSKKNSEADELHHKQVRQLEQISGLTKEEAKEQIVETYVNEAKSESVQLIKNIRDEAQRTARKEAQSIVLQAIQRTASDHSVESNVSVVNLDSDEMKGRIIGREGRNIRAFESATGIDLIIDDTPEAVVISGFDPFRREVAKRSLENLMADGRIHPARIEEIVEKTRLELDQETFQVGEGAILELGIHNIHPELIRMIGKMKYRSSYGQNLLNHSTEVSYISGLMAAELGLDAKMAKRAGLLHDIGKCIDKNTEGPHALLGMDFAKKYKENKVVCNAIGAHHEDIEILYPLSVLIQAADGISGARPGARRESLENYIKRLEKLEAIAQSNDGVSKTFAIQAGREIRVIVEPDRIDDVNADSLASEIASKIEQEMEYPGQIKVTVIRERRSVALAK